MKIIFSNNAINLAEFKQKNFVFCSIIWRKLGSVFFLTSLSYLDYSYTYVVQRLKNIWQELTHIVLGWPSLSISFARPSPPLFSFYVCPEFCDPILQIRETILAVFLVLATLYNRVSYRCFQIIFCYILPRIYSPYM